MRPCHFFQRLVGVCGNGCLKFLSRLNEIDGSCEKILPVSLSFWSNLKSVKMMFLAVRICG